MPSSALKKKDDATGTEQAVTVRKWSHLVVCFWGNWVPLPPGRRGQGLQAVSCIHVNKSKAKSQFFKLQPVTSFILR